MASAFEELFGKSQTDQPSFFGGSEPSWASNADANGNIQGDMLRSQSFLENPGGYASAKMGALSNSPDISWGNAFQGLTRFMGPMGTGLSGLAGLFGIGTHDTGNPATNFLMQPTFGIGTNNASPAVFADSSRAYTNPGATGFSSDWLTQPVPMGQPQAQNQPQANPYQFNPRAPEFATGPITAPPMPDFSQMAAASQAPSGFVPQYGDQNAFGSMGSFLNTFMSGANEFAGNGRWAWGAGGGGGGADGWGGLGASSASGGQKIGTGDSQ